MIDDRGNVEETASLGSSEQWAACALLSALRWALRVRMLRAAGAARASQELGVCESRVQTAVAFEKVLAYRTAAWSR